MKAYFKHSTYNLRDTRYPLTSYPCLSFKQEYFFFPRTVTDVLFNQRGTLLWAISLVYFFPAHLLTRAIWSDIFFIRTILWGYRGSKSSKTGTMARISERRASACILYVWRVFTLMYTSYLSHPEDHYSFSVSMKSRSRSRVGVSGSFLVITS